MGADTETGAKRMRTPMSTIAGLATSRGFVSGPVFLYHCDDAETPVPEYAITADQVPAELARLDKARQATRAQIEALVTELRNHVKDGAQQDTTVFDGHLMMLDDATMRSSVELGIRERHLNAEAAVRAAADVCRGAFEKMGDAYLRERARDVEDVESRLVRNLMGEAPDGLADLKTPSIIVAPDLTPSETVGLPKNLVLGFATDRGSTTSHVALLARALGIPAVVGLGDVSSRVEAGDVVLLDGTNGAVTISPDEPTRQEFARLVAREKELLQILDEDKSLPGTMKDGHKVRLMANVHPGVPMSNLRTFGAEGIGLYRSEYLWLNGSQEPTEEEQARAYGSAVRAMGPDAPVTIRVLDIGGDKLVKGVNLHESNPFLGNRSIRYLLSHREVFRTQLRAILRASACGRVDVMYPMVATVGELREANAELAGEMEKMRAAGIPFDEHLKRGVMIELPSAALNAARFAQEADFFSIGTNDLVQYTMAADRGNEAVAYLYQPTNPAVLKLIDMTVHAATEAGIPVAVCGETAADPILGVLWIGMGVTELSMSCSYIPVLKKVLRELTFADASALADEVRGLFASRSAQEIYAFCQDYLMRKVPDLAEIQSFFTHGSEF